MERIFSAAKAAPKTAHFERSAYEHNRLSGEKGIYTKGYEYSE